MKNNDNALLSCMLCPRRCGVNRLEGQRGVCRAGALAEVYRYAPHYGEEPPISGTAGSGTIFFSRCTLSCVYCQNFPWSQGDAGDSLEVAQLVAAFRELADAGCHNWNLVSPTPWLPQIADALGRLRDEGVRLPVVYNTSGYERRETLAAFESWVDVYLTDLRYAKSATAQMGSSATDYVDVARAALRDRVERLGPLRCDENGIAISGVICRLLVLPGFADEVIENLEWMADVVGVDVPVSVMAQYQPAYRALKEAPWNRKITRDEYDRVCQAVESLGFDTGWIQEFSGDVDEGLVGHTMEQGGFAGP
jgi:putative pyruvate formate lyase activating enzyme